MIKKSLLVTGCMHQDDVPPFAEVSEKVDFAKLFSLAGGGWINSSLIVST